MVESGLALSIDVTKAYFLELSNGLIQNLRFNTTVNTKAIGELLVFLDSFQINDLNGQYDSWILDISTVTKIINKKRQISLAGITQSKVNLKLSSDDNSELLIQVLDIDFDWTALKTSIQGSRKSGMDNLVKSIFNLAENTISRKLSDLITSEINGFKKPYLLRLPPLIFFDTQFKVDSEITEIRLAKLEADDQRISTLIQLSLDSIIKDEENDGELKINKISIVNTTNELIDGFNSLIKVILSDKFINELFNSYLKTLENDNDFPVDLNKVSLSSEQGFYKVQIETDNKAAELVQFNLSFVITEFSNFPEIELNEFKIEGKGIVGAIAKQFLRAYKRKLSALISQKWLELISIKISEIKSEGIQYKWNELDILIPIKNIDIHSHEINPQKGLILNAHIATGPIIVSCSPEINN